MKTKMMADRAVLEQIIRNERKQREEEFNGACLYLLRCAGFVFSASFCRAVWVSCVLVIRVYNTARAHMALFECIFSPLYQSAVCRDHARSCRDYAIIVGHFVQECLGSAGG